MPSNEKNLNKSLKGDELARISSLAGIVLEGIKTSEALSVKLSEIKKELNVACTKIFLKDLENGSVFGNHIIEVNGEKLVVNFKMSPESDIADYEKSLRADLKENYSELFHEVPTTEVITMYPNLRKQFNDHPELFIMTLKKSVTMIQMLKVFEKFPDLFDVIVRDMERYAEVYPSSVKVTKKVFPNHGILEKLGRMEEVLRKRVVTTLSKFFSKNLECAIKEA